MPKAASTAARSTSSPTTTATAPKTVEQAHWLVRSDEVLLIFNPLSTPNSTAIEIHEHQEGAANFRLDRRGQVERSQELSLDHGLAAELQTETRICAAYILKNHPGKTIGVLYQNDDFGLSYIIGLRDGLGDQASKLIVIEILYETASPTVD